MRVFIVALALLTAACGPTIDGTELGGVATVGTTPGPALRAAQEHCAKYGRVARAGQITTWGHYVTFSCERPERS